MSINEFHRRYAIAHRRVLVLCDRYTATDDPAKRAAINLAIGEELNSVPDIREVR